MSAAALYFEADMGKKKPKATLYVEIDATLKARLDKMAQFNGRKLTAEVSRALEFYLAAHEPKEQTDR
jgi:predicted transcriptional regulator